MGDAGGYSGVKRIGDLIIVVRINHHPKRDQDASDQIVMRDNCLVGAGDEIEELVRCRGVDVGEWSRGVGRELSQVQRDTVDQRVADEPFGIIGETSLDPLCAQILTDQIVWTGGPDFFRPASCDLYAISPAVVAVEVVAPLPIASTCFDSDFLNTTGVAEGEDGGRVVASDEIDGDSRRSIVRAWKNRFHDRHSLGDVFSVELADNRSGWVVLVAPERFESRQKNCSQGAHLQDGKYVTSDYMHAGPFVVNRVFRLPIARRHSLKHFTGKN